MTSLRPDGLDAAEDDELRHLASLSEYGLPGGAIGARMAVLRQRDRRATVRPPRRPASAEPQDASTH